MKIYNPHKLGETIQYGQKLENQLSTNKYMNLQCDKTILSANEYPNTRLTTNYQKRNLQIQVDNLHINTSRRLWLTSKAAGCG